MPNVGHSCGLTKATERGGEQPYRNVLRADPVVARNVFLNNHAWEAAGGIRFCFFGGALPTPAVTANLIVNNRTGQRGGGIVIIDAELTITGTTIVGNECDEGQGGGVFVGVEGALILRNSIVAGNMGSGIHIQAGDLITDYCDVFGNSTVDYANCTPSATDISCSPEFCASESGDYRLFETSCCQGAGAGGDDIGARGVGCFTVPDVLFFDNFSDQNDEGWLVTSEGDATLQVDVGTYRASLVDGAVIGAIASGFASGNLAYRLRIRPETALPPADTGVDIYLRREAPARYYRVCLSDGEGKLWKRIDDEEQVLLSFPCQLVTGGWQSLSFELMDRQLSGHLDSGEGPQELFNYVDDTLPILTGTLGLGLSGHAMSERVARYDDVLVAANDSQTSVLPNETLGMGSPPTSLVLRVFPNPASPSAKLDFVLPGAQHARLAIYSVEGRRVATLLDELLTSGRHWIVWNGSDAHGRQVASGIYFCRLEIANSAETKRLTLIR